jgi:hypothetical protein
MINKYNRIIDFFGQLIISIGLLYLMVKMIFLINDIKYRFSIFDKLVKTNIIFEEISKTFIFSLWTFVIGFSFIFFSYWINNKNKDKYKI